MDDVSRLRAEVVRLRAEVSALAWEVRAVRRGAELGALPAPSMIRRAEAAALLGVKPGTLAAWARDGRGPPYEVFGKRALYPVAALQEWREHSGAVREPTREPEPVAAMPLFADSNG